MAKKEKSEQDQVQEQVQDQVQPQAQSGPQIPRPVYVRPDCPLHTLMIEKLDTEYFERDPDAENERLYTHSDIEDAAKSYIESNGANAIYALCGWDGTTAQSFPMRIRKEFAEAASTVWEGRAQFGPDNDYGVLGLMFHMIRTCNELCKAVVQ